MARSLSEIYDELMTEVAGNATLAGLQPNPDNMQTFLNDLTTKSKVAMWRLIIYVVAFGIWVHEMLWDEKMIELEDAAAKAIPGTLRWWYEQCLIWQYGDGLSWIDGKYQYYPVNIDHRIIKYPAPIEVAGTVQLKVAKDDGTGNPIPLTDDEKASFATYADLIEPAGTIVNIISEDADLLHVEYDIYYDSLLLNPDGTLITDPSVKPVENAINIHIKNLKFNGYLYLSELDDAIQEATGVADIERNIAEAKYGILPYTAIDVKYNANAGHMKIDPLHPLSGALNYIPA